MHTQMSNESQQFTASVIWDPLHHVYRGRVSDLSPELADLIGLDMPAPTKPWNYRQTTTSTCLTCTGMPEIRIAFGSHTAAISLTSEDSPLLRNELVKLRGGSCLSGSLVLTPLIHT